MNQDLIYNNLIHTTFFSSTGDIGFLLEIRYKKYLTIQLPEGGVKTMQ